MKQGYIPAFVLEPEKKAVPATQPAASNTPRFIDDVAAGRVELPTIPRVVQRIIAALRDPDVDARRVGEALSQDPVLSAKVLRVANSSFFGGQRSMASIDAAVAMIGTQALHRIIVSCGVASTFKEIVGIDLPLFWRDALVAATAANRLARLLDADPEEAYVGGLLHATGHLILCQSYPAIAEAMFSGFAVLRGAELASVELDAFGIDHPTVGALWVESLGFPQAVIDAIRSTVEPLAEAALPLRLAVSSACWLAKAVAQQHGAADALAGLPAAVAALFSEPVNDTKAGFCSFYEDLLAIEPGI